MDKLPVQKLNAPVPPQVATITVRILPNGVEVDVNDACLKIPDGKIHSMWRQVNRAVRVKRGKVIHDRRVAEAKAEALKVV